LLTAQRVYRERNSICFERGDGFRNGTQSHADESRAAVGGSGGEVRLVTDWERDYGVPADIVKGGICSSGIRSQARAHFQAQLLHPVYR
jgi:hypothetical protein